MTTLAHGDWEKTQIKVFGRWVAKQLSKRHIQFLDVTSEFADGVKLINLLEIVGKEEIGKKWHPNPKGQFQCVENLDAAVDFMTNKKKIKVIGISGKDIYDKNLRLTLGLTWTIINKFLIEEISVEEATARDALLLWCQKNTKGYDGVDVKNFHKSWNDGLAFCALLNKFRPNLLDYSALDHSQCIDNCAKAFDVMNQLGITVYLDPEDVCCDYPDDKSIVTQVAELFHYFAADTKAENEAEKLKRLLGFAKEVEGLVNNYIEQAKATLAAADEEAAQVADDSYEKTIPGLKGKLVALTKYGKVGHPRIAKLKGTAEVTYSTLNMKCHSKNRKMPAIEEGLLPPALDARLEEVDGEVTAKRRALLDEIHAKTTSYNEESTKLIAALKEISEALDTGLEGDYESKSATLSQQEANVNAQRGALAEITALYDELEAAELHLEIENTPTIIEVSLENIVDRITKLRLTIDAAAAAEQQGIQISAEKMEEYKQTFIHFDADSNGDLAYYELKACLTALGEDITDEQAKELRAKYAVDDKMSFECFSKFMEDNFASTETAEGYKESFKVITGGAPVITAAQIDQFFPDDAEFLKANLPEVEGGYDYISYIENNFE